MNNPELEEYFKNNFNTPIPKDKQKAYDDWIKTLSEKKGRDMGSDTMDYDLQGYYLNGGDKDAGLGHMPDTFKKPNHPTFSNESIYNGAPDPNGGKFEGGQWGENDSFIPSLYMIQNTHDPIELQNYFQKYEPGSKLILPGIADEELKRQIAR